MGVIIVIRLNVRCKWYGLPWQSSAMICKVSGLAKFSLIYISIFVIHSVSGRAVPPDLHRLQAR